MAADYYWSLWHEGQHVDGYISQITTVPFVLLDEEDMWKVPCLKENNVQNPGKDQIPELLF